MKTITIIPPAKDLRALVGYRLGKKIYKKQVKQYVTDDCITIEFPEHIEKFSISFISGFMEKLLKDYGYEWFIAKLSVTGHPDAIRMFYRMVDIWK